MFGCVDGPAELLAQSDVGIPLVHLPFVLLPAVVLVVAVLFKTAEADLGLAGSDRGMIHGHFSWVLVKIVRHKNIESIITDKAFCCTLSV